MRASLKAAVTAFTVHQLSPATDQDPGEGHEQLGFLRRLAAGDVRNKELVDWADTIAAALMSFSAPRGATAPPSASSASSTTPTRPRATPTPEMHSSAHHNTAGCSSAIRNTILERDGHACVVTGVRDAIALEVAHIIPPSVRRETAAFRGLLGIFMGAERLEALRTATLHASVGEVANRMVLNVLVHRYFDGGSVEILPVVGSGDWGVGREYGPSVVSSYNISIHYPGSAALPLARCVYPTPAPDTQTGQQLLSAGLLTPGITITLTTPDPATMPLPHPLLLQLHAICGRVKRLRAAAGWPVLPPGDGSDGGIQWGEEESDIGGRGGKGESAVTRFTMEPPEQSIRGWVRGCSLGPVGGDSGVGPGAGAERDNKWKFGDGMEQLEEGPDDGERPRKVAAVMEEMEMREEERRRLVGR